MLLSDVVHKPTQRALTALVLTVFGALGARLLEVRIVLIDSVVCQMHANHIQVLEAKQENKSPEKKRSKGRSNKGKEEKTKGKEKKNY